MACYNQIKLLLDYPNFRRAEDQLHLWYLSVWYVILFNNFRVKHLGCKYIHMIVIIYLQTAVTWLKYCQYGVKLYQINQSIN